ARPEGVDALGVVADSVETDSAYERAVEAFLADRLQAVLTASDAVAVRGIRFLEESGAGRGAFLSLSSGRLEYDCACLRDIQRLEPGVKGLLSDFYRVSGDHADAIRAALPDTLVVEGIDDALDIA